MREGKIEGPNSMSRAGLKVEVQPEIRGRTRAVAGINANRKEQLASSSSGSNVEGRKEGKAEECRVDLFRHQPVGARTRARLQGLGLAH